MDQGRRQSWPSWKKCERRQYQSLQSFEKSNAMIYRKWVSVNWNKAYPSCVRTCDLGWAEKIIRWHDLKSSDATSANKEADDRCQAVGGSDSSSETNWKYRSAQFVLVGLGTNVVPQRPLVLPVASNLISTLYRTLMYFNICLT